jgi:hypothetical protein
VAERALPPGAVRRRAVFGLFDADGWTWAGLKATFWFLFVIFMLGYIPNLAYNFVVKNTVPVGYNFLSIINWCPASNEDLPCPVPAGATLPWQSSPPELALPAARTGAALFQSGELLYAIGGSVDGMATDEVFVAEAISDEEGTLTGNITRWSDAPTLPEPRSDAALGIYVGVPYVVGGLDASGNPTDTTFKGVVEDGRLTGWELADGEEGTDPLTLPRPLSDASVINGTSGFVLVGGRGADGEPTDGVHVAWVDPAATGGRLLAWQPLEGLALPEARAGSVAANVGDFFYVIGGEGPDGPSDSVFRLELVQVPDESGDATVTEPATDAAGRPLGWAVAPEDLRLPEPRVDASPFATGGSIYVIGGTGADGSPQSTVYWAVPDTTTGDLTDGWQHLAQTDLPVANADAPVAGVGSTAFLIGGAGPDGPSDGLMRAALAPDPPFFQLGIAGATIPAMSIKGEIGQQLGYLVAAGVATTNFIVLVIMGVALSRPAASRRVISRLSRGRLAPPPEDDYTA